MRLWSIHPSYLDRQGLLAVWREGLLAQKVLLQGEYKKCSQCKGTGMSYEDYDCVQCKGTGKIKTPYYNHPQLLRFKQEDISYIGNYLWYIYLEAKSRKYNFDKNKIVYSYLKRPKLTITIGQLIYEFNYLQDKLFIRNKKKMEENFDLIKQYNISKIETHPLFKIIEGDIEKWEK